MAGLTARLALRERGELVDVFERPAAARFATGGVAGAVGVLRPRTVFVRAAFVVAGAAFERWVALPGERGVAAPRAVFFVAAVFRVEVFFAAVLAPVFRTLAFALAVRAVFFEAAFLAGAARLLGARLVARCADFFVAVLRPVFVLALRVFVLALRAIVVLRFSPRRARARIH